MLEKYARGRSDKGLDERIADVCIAGSGPVASLLAALLGEQRIDVRLAGDARAPADRPIALSHGSRMLLERVGAFAALKATPIRAIHVSQVGGFGRTVIRAEDHALEALGHVVSYSALCAALASR